MRGTFLLLVAVWVGCGSEGGHGAAVPVRADEPRPVAPAPLAVALRYPDPSSNVGWGSLDLSAHPMEHEIRVDMMVGAAVSATRWRYCGAGELSVDGRRQILPLRYSGVPMDDGLYDAVTVDITIEDVRRMADADDVEVVLCGHRVSLSRDQLGSLHDFVRRFEEMATYEGPPAPEPRPTLDWEPDVPVMDGRSTES